MSNWRDQILKEFTPNVARLTLVADPDGLLLEEGILEGIRERGFELIPFDDHVAFRYAYESRFRFRWDRGEQTDLVVVLHSAENVLSCLPFDLLQAGRCLSFNLGEMFPTLSYPIVTALDRSDLDALYKAVKNNTPGILGDNATKEFVLRHVFEIAPELIRKPSDLLHALLRRHYREQRIPALLDERFVQVLHQQGGFEEWPLEKIVPDREAFFAFLQERWPIFLNRSAIQDVSGSRDDDHLYRFNPLSGQPNGTAETHTEGTGAMDEACQFTGPADLPFDHDDIRIYIDNLFVEGLLEAVPHSQAESFSSTWLAIGIRADKQADRKRRMESLFDAVTSDMPDESARHDDWFHFARTWAELIALIQETHAVLPGQVCQQMENLQVQVDSAFFSWLKKRYAGLINLPPAPPVMLHHIPRFLSRHIQDDRKHKVAFVLVDGLSLDQWIVIRKELARQRPSYRFRERAVFAWIPTITSVSRQAAFAGKPPVYFPDSIHSTEKETVLWTKFWVDQGLTHQEIAYAKGLGNGTMKNVEAIVSRPRMRSVGLVVDKVDKIMHGMTLGSAGMHNQVRQWAAGPFLVKLFDLLLKNGFKVYLSSDHGNIEAEGCGRPLEGAVADLRGSRARIYPDSILRSKVKMSFPDALEWPPVGLPDAYLPLLAPARSAFASKTETIVGHGGASLEEIVVPFVQIERKNI